MTAKRDSPTIARASEPLAVHPLLGPATTSDNAKYVPYTPRQRPAPAPPTTTTKPQLAHLKAVAQTIGLDANSVGWAILEKISYEGDTSDEWSEIWHALTKTKATLLLPSEPNSTHDLITPDFVQDHLILTTRDNAAVLTLSGLRGQRVNDTLTFRSTLHRSTKQFQSLWARTTSLDALAPLPCHPLESSYPSFTVSAFNAALPLPSRPTKPPLPPRPSVRPAPTSSSARLMPFASLFGQRPSTPPPTTTTTTTPQPTDIESVIDISAFVIDTPLPRTEMATDIISALKGEIAIALSLQPPWLLERVHTFSTPYFPFVKVPAGKKKLQDIGGNPNRVVYAVNGRFDESEELADKFQAFYRSIEEELRNGDHARAQVEEDEMRIRDTLETIEATLCRLLYDRLFLPSTSDDASHNEALSSRIAALNMLDLGLEHLDIDIGDANHAEVDAIVRTCGQTLAQLDDAHCPSAKAAVLVSAHKLVVEGLPPVRLKSRDEVDKERPPGPTDSDQHTSTIPSESPLISTVQLSTLPDTTPPSEVTPPSTSSPVSGDVLLPILIYSVVKANPHRLVSHLLFIQRFRNQSIGGEESYCLINLMAVAEFLENVDLGALGLGESEKKVPSTADLTPIPITRPNLPDSPIASTLPGDEHPASLRGRVGQGVDAIAGSANKVILGVVDSSFGVLRALLPGQTTQINVSAGARTPGSGAGVSTGTSVGAGETDAAVWGVRPSLGLLRRETGFSIAGLTVALPGGNKVKSQEEGQRELVDVSSRPASLKSHRSGRDEESGAERSSEEEGSAQTSEDGGGAEIGGEDGEAESDGESEGKGEDREEEGEEGEEEEVHDTRSIKSFESMLSSGRAKRKTDGASSRGRKRLTDLTDRLTHGMAGMSRRVQGGDAAHRGTTWTGRSFPPPNRRFVECSEQDIRVGEVGELLREYQRLVEAVRTAGGFQE